MGYLVLSNGVPVGYGGASALYRQVNTGINIFDEYRGSEAAFFWVQVMRVYRQLTGVGAKSHTPADASWRVKLVINLGIRPTASK